jgi:hypothetical protein
MSAIACHRAYPQFPKPGINEIVREKRNQPLERDKEDRQIQRDH